MAFAAMPKKHDLWYYLNRMTRDARNVQNHVRKLGLREPAKDTINTVIEHLTQASRRIKAEARGGAKQDQ